MADFIYPSNFELMTIEREKLPRLTQNRPAFQILPPKNIDAATLVYEQLENIKGLMQVRGLGGDPKSVEAQGLGIKYTEPGYYGEFRTLNEVEMTLRRQYGTMNTPINLSDLVMEAQDQLLERRLNRQELLIWTLLAQGTFTALGSVGQVLHTDSYSIQSYTAGIPWATQATSFPLANLRAVKLLARGTSANFGRQSTLWVNQGTANAMFSNINQNDLGGKREAGLSSVTGIEDINKIYLREDLPQVVVYDEGYFDQSGVFQLYIPNNKAILIGVRQSGTPIGNFQMTRNANNPDFAPGAYMRVIDRLETTVPRKVEVHDGFNGGPVLFFPSAVVSMNV